MFIARSKQLFLEPNPKRAGASITPLKGLVLFTTQNRTIQKRLTLVETFPEKL